MAEKKPYVLDADDDESDSDSHDIVMLNPTTEFVKPFIYANIESIKKLYRYDPFESGKWMMFFHKSVLDVKWKMCCDMYKARNLIGIRNMKVSTNFKNPRASDYSTGVIIFYCGPASDEEAVMSYGKNLLEKIPYRGRGPYMYYKADVQTLAGTRATGQKKNHMYKIPVSVLPESWR